MAPRLAHSDNIIFLFKCIECTGVKIDFSKTASDLGSNANTVRMRYVRLRKAAEGGLATQASTTWSTKSLKLSKFNKKKRPVKDPIAAKKRKRLQNEDVVAESDYASSEVAETANSIVDSTTKRTTRGIKIDFTSLLDGTESTGSASASDEASSFEPDGIPHSALDANPDRVKTPPRPQAGILMTPPDSKQSIKQVSASPEPRLNAQFDRFSNPLTPPESAKKQATVTPEPTSSTISDDVRANIMHLQTGQRVLGTMYKKRKLNTPGVASEYSPSSSLLRVSKTGFVLKTEDDDRGGDDSVVDSVSPDDSASLLDEVGIPREKAKTKVSQEQRTFMQRLSSFWR